MNVLIRMLLALTTAVLLVASLLHPLLWALAGVALAPWLIATKQAGRFEAIWLGAAVGTGFGCLVVAWIPEALQTLGSSSTTAFAGLVLTAAWAKAPLFAAFGLLVRELARVPAWIAVALPGALVGFGEKWISVSSWGVPGALVGHSQVPALGVSQLAVVGGVPLISAWLVALNAAIALAISRVKGARSLAVALAAGWIAIAALGLSVAERVRPAPPENRSASILIVQPDLPSHTRWVSDAQPWVLQHVAAHTDEALASDPGPLDLIVWPENLLTTPIDAAPALAQVLQQQVDRWGVPLVTGVVRRAMVNTGYSYRSSVVWIEPQQGVIDAIDKVRAVPLLESSRAIPGAPLLSSLFGGAARSRKVEEASSAGALKGRFTLTAVLCYEVLFPELVAERRPPQSLAVLNLADDSWVEGEAATRQLSAWATFRAIEQRLTLIRVAHGGLSVVIDPFGRTVQELPLDRFTHARVIVASSASPTLEERIVILSVALTPVLVVGCWQLRSYGKRGPNHAKPNSAHHSA